MRPLLNWAAPMQTEIALGVQSRTRTARAICSKSRWGRSIPRPTACSAWTSCWMANGWSSSSRSSAILHRNHEKIAEDATYLAVDALHRPAGLLLLADQQLGLRAGGRKAGRPAGARTRRIHPRHYGGTDAPAESCLPGRLSAAGHGRVGHAADVRLPRAGKDSRPVRIAHRRAHDVQLHALWRLPL